jgi:hypothetical protein
MAAAENKFSYPLNKHNNLQPAIKNTIFELNKKFYVIQYGSNTNESFRSDRIHKENPIYTMEEFLQQESGTYLWVMGKDENKKIHTVFTETKSIQEIGTTHSNIVHRIFFNHNYNRNLIPKMDTLLYAGEIKLDNDSKEIIINFLSGTFMLDRVNLNKKNNINIAKNQVLQQFSEEINIPGYTIIFDDSRKTFIVQQMTIGQLIEYYNAGLSIYQFNTKQEAKEFISIPLKKAKLIARKKSKERLPEKYRNQKTINNFQTQINELEEITRKEKLTLQELENIQQEILLSEVKRNRKRINGGKKRKNKTKRKKLKNKRKTKKYIQKN